MANNPGINECLPVYTGIMHCLSDSVILDWLSVPRGVVRCMTSLVSQFKWYMRLESMPVLSCVCEYVITNWVSRPSRQWCSLSFPQIQGSDVSCPYPQIQPRLFGHQCPMTCCQPYCTAGEIKPCFSSAVDSDCRSLYLLHFSFELTGEIMQKFR